MKAPSRTSTYLYRVAHLLPKLNPSAETILQSHLMTKCRSEYASTSAQIRCPHCCVFYETKRPKHEVRPKPKQSRFRQKLMKWLASGRPLTKYQKKQVKTCLKKGTCNVLTKKCSLCNHVTKTKLRERKPKPVKIVTPVAVMSSRKRKRKAKDKLKGLNKDAVLSANINSQNVSNVIDLVTPVKSARKSIDSSLIDLTVVESTTKSSTNKSRKKKRQKSGVSSQKIVSQSKITNGKVTKKAKNKFNIRKQLENIFNARPNSYKPTFNLSSFLVQK